MRVNPDNDLVRGVTGVHPYPDHLWLPDGAEWFVKDVGPWRITVSPMLFNFRIHLMDEEDRQPPVRSITAGFCYNPKELAMVWATAWDPVTDLRPGGFIKEAYNGRRKGWWRGCTNDQLDDLVDQWHTRFAGKQPYDVTPLNDWLGMTKAEYDAWVINPDVIDKEQESE